MSIPNSKSVHSVTIHPEFEFHLDSDINLLNTSGKTSILLSLMNKCPNHW
ncbi:hypothetical protein HNP81_003213 [Peribacillus huizhouensis]|uniref:Rad50/SbcC-type AAA domain-containing protein n=1 Tax=Peribacillus huizhouensis TaxID=1501239 RepID=A0ABR6CT66_9BACI|nr:hypothetical protein [Peribacillus huizhouensis]